MNMKQLMAKIPLIAAAALLGACSGASVNYDAKENSIAQAGSNLVPPTGDEAAWEEIQNDDGIFNEKYNAIKENPYVLVGEENQSYFSLDSWTASYSNLRRFINSGAKITGDVIKTDELINYFDYSFAKPAKGQDFASFAEISNAPWNQDHKLLTMAVTTKEAEIDPYVGNNYVFLIDVSGSMNGSERLGLVKQSFGLLLDNLNASDRISVVTYASGVNVLIDGAFADSKDAIMSRINALQASGGTYGEGGVEKAYEIAQKWFIAGGNNRVIVASDGDFNIGKSRGKDLEEMVAAKRESGIYLTCLGFGMYNYSDVTMETLAKHGNGGYFYINTISEAEKVLVNDLKKTLFTVAKDVKCEVTFDKATVQSYRLIGYENKGISRQDFYDENKDAGEVGSGHTSVVCYELILNENAQLGGGLANLNIHYKDPKNDESKEYANMFSLNEAEVSEDHRFVASVVEFSLALRDSEYKGNADYQRVIDTLAELDSVAQDQLKSEFLELVKTAKKQNLLSVNEVETVIVYVVMGWRMAGVEFEKGLTITPEDISKRLNYKNEMVGYYLDEDYVTPFEGATLQESITLYAKIAEATTPETQSVEGV